MSPSASLRVGLVQTRTPATQAAALDHVAPLVREAAAGGAQLILTPECTNALSSNRDHQRSVLRHEDHDETLAALRDHPQLKFEQLLDLIEEGDVSELGQHAP